MRKWPKLTCLLTLIAAALPFLSGLGQEGGGPIEYSRHRHFRIPITLGPGAERLKQLQLFVSTNQGQNWEPSAVVPPDARDFHFTCDRDGLYWFTVQTQDKQGALYPASLQNAQPSLKVLVDSIPPDVRLQPLAGRGNQVGVQWDIREEYIDLNDPKALRLEYRVAGGYAWIPLSGRAVDNQFFWNPETNAELEVRLRVQDRAGNLGESTTTLRPGQDPGGYSPVTERPTEGGGYQGNGGGYQGPLPHGYSADAPNRRLVNSKRIRLNYNLSEVGPSGVSKVELWYTQDGRRWDRTLEHSPQQADSPGPLVFDVPREGIYGFTIVAKSGVGLGGSPPQIGDQPQVWVEVDTTRPAVELQGVTVGRGVDKGKLTVSWSATDKNLRRDPITLSYAEQLAGPWSVIAENANNTGRYVWSMPETVPYQFWVRVEAADLAGNVGEAVSRDLVKVDLAQPKVNILNVQPDLNGGGS